MSEQPTIVASSACCPVRFGKAKCFLSECFLSRSLVATAAISRAPSCGDYSRLLGETIFYDISPFATRKDLVARPAGKMLVCSFGCLDLNDLIQSLAMWAMHQGKSCVFANHVGGPNTPPPSFSASHLVAGFCCGTFSATQVMGKKMRALLGFLFDLRQK